jgi:hypothetical protein
MIKVGLLGYGSFGKKIESKLNEISSVSIEWICTSKDEWWTNAIDLDWVIIATPNEFHYEQAKHFMKQGINVFCEKPGTLSVESLQDLIRMSEDNGVKFYIDDVLSYENVTRSTSFTYKKWAGTSYNMIDRIAYHHFYLIYNVLGNVDIHRINITKNDVFHKKFQIMFGNTNYSFEYDFKSYKDNVNSVECNAKRDALETMLRQVLTETADFETNHKRSLFATRVSEHVKQNLYGRCAVVGAGIYGITAAIKLRTAGYSVDLYEAEDDIMKAASGINQYRVHRGYHYPRSSDTIESCKNNEESFIKYYSPAIVDDYEHYYAIASEESLVTAEQYLSTLDNSKLKWEIVDTLPNCDLTIKVDEKLYNPTILADICKERIKGSGVNLILNKEVSRLENYKHVVYATYSKLNQLVDSWKVQDYQFELCEKPIFKLPEQYSNKSIVIMDGPFMCFDPLAESEYHLGGNVVHAIHVRNIGEKPEIPSVYKNYLNKGLIVKPKYTNVDRFIESAKKFFPDIEQAEHIGSMYTIRTVLPNKDNTDERPTIVTQHENNFVLFSGKVGNCVDAADKIIRLINEN